MPAYLVTGGAGFLGAHLVRAILKEPALRDGAVVVLDDLSGGFQENVPQDPRVTFVHGSINDAKLIERLFHQYQFRFVYHLAAYAAEGLSHFIRRFNYSNNLLGSMNLINAAVNNQTECFVFTSSIAVYGSAQTPMTEETTPQPEDPYGIAKYAVELDLHSAHEMFGLNYVIFRPHNVYGELQNIGDKYRNVVGIFMNRLLQGQPMPIFGDGEQQRAFTYVQDIAPIMASAPLNGAAQNDVFNLGADQPCTVNELARLTAAALGLPVHVEHLPARNEVRTAFANHLKIRNVFGPSPETPLEKGLQQMASWVQGSGVRPSKNFSAIEIPKNLPESWR
jgi:UDP-glucose 4-epimerase